MIEYISGDIFEIKVDALVNPVNTVGIMGKGLALAFKQKFPNNFKLYKKACDSKQIIVGKIFSTINVDSDNPKYIINFPTKDHWKYPSKIEWVESGLNDLRDFIISNKIRSIAIPALGCGNGGLNWDDVDYLFNKILRGINSCNIIIYTPNQ